MYRAFLIFLWLPFSGFSQDTLYLGCQNILPLDTLHTQILSISGAKISIEAGKQAIVPFANHVVIKVKENNLIREVRYPVKNIPLPSAKLFSNVFGGAHSPKSPAPLYIDVRLVPEEVFAVKCPADARYRATITKVEVRRRGILIDFFEGAMIHPLKMKEVQPGDIVEIEVTGLERLNFKNEIEKIEYKKILTTTL
jgi:hypothetical protein